MIPSGSPQLIVISNNVPVLFKAVFSEQQRDQGYVGRIHSLKTDTGIVTVKVDVLN